MKKILTLLTAILWLSVMQLKAQSVSYAKSLIKEERYMDAAKQLRPLADAGDAEAQYLAATLFFEGRGVAKNNEQGIKYAKLSADQGNTDAMLLLADHYKDNKQMQKYHQTLLYYIDRHPYLKNEFIGIRLAECYMIGCGVAQDEDKAWEMSKSNRFFKKMQTAYPYQWSSYKSRHPELYATQVYDDISVAQGPNFCTIQKVVFEAERTVVYLHYVNNIRVPQTISAMPRSTYIEAGGKRFNCTGSTLRQTVVPYNKAYSYEMYFEPVRRDVDSFDLVENMTNGWAWRGVTFR